MVVILIITSSISTTAVGISLNTHNPTLYPKKARAFLGVPQTIVQVISYR